MYINTGLGALRRPAPSEPDSAISNRDRIAATKPQIAITQRVKPIGTQPPAIMPRPEITVPYNRPPQMPAVTPAIVRDRTVAPPPPPTPPNGLQYARIDNRKTTAGGTPLTAATVRIVNGADPVASEYHDNWQGQVGLSIAEKPAPPNIMPTNSGLEFDNTEVIAPPTVAAEPEQGNALLPILAIAAYFML